MQPAPIGLVTGASSGVGVHFARELARRQHDLILSARRVERLEELKQELESQFGIQATVLPSDLDSVSGAKQLHQAVRELGRPIRILVNNAGLGYFGRTVEQSLAEIESMIQVNVLSLTVLARLFAEEMRARGEGYILNHASFSAIQPTPLYAVYSGTKSYVLAFSQALRHDLRVEGVRVSALCPGFFDSDFYEKAGQEPTFLVRQMILPAEQVARTGIRGVLRGQAVIIPGWRYRLLNLTMRFFPRTVATAVADFAVKH